MIKITRHHDLARAHEGRERNHLFIAATHENFLNIIRRIAACAHGLHDHIVLLALAFVARHVAATEHRLDRAAHGIHTHAQISGFFAVNF